jgi:hypothetical protein
MVKAMPVSVILVLAISKKSERRKGFRYGLHYYDDPSLYHMALNMNHVDLDTATKLVCDMVAGK